MPEIVVQFIDQSKREPKILGRIAYDKTKGLYWISCENRKLQGVINDPVDLGLGRLIYPDKHPKEWISSLYRQYRNQYLMATRPNQDFSQELVKAIIRKQDPGTVPVRVWVKDPSRALGGYYAIRYVKPEEAAAMREKTPAGVEGWRDVISRFPVFSPRQIQLQGEDKLNKLIEETSEALREVEVDVEEKVYDQLYRPSSLNLENLRDTIAIQHHLLMVKAKCQLELYSRKSRPYLKTITIDPKMIVGTRLDVPKLYEYLSILPEQHLQWLRNITWDPTNKLKSETSPDDYFGLFRSTMPNTLFFGTGTRGQESTVFHELAHIIMHAFTQNTDEFLQMINQYYQIALRDNSTVTTYARTDVDEYFAESYYAYVVNPTALKEWDPDVYNFLRQSIFDGREYPGVEIPTTVPVVVTPRTSELRPLSAERQQEIHTEWSRQLADYFPRSRDEDFVGEAGTNLGWLKSMTEKYGGAQVLYDDDGRSLGATGITTQDGKTYTFHGAAQSPLALGDKVHGVREMLFYHAFKQLLNHTPKDFNLVGIWGQSYGDLLTSFGFRPTSFRGQRNPGFIASRKQIEDAVKMLEESDIDTSETGPKQTSQRTPVAPSGSERLKPSRERTPEAREVPSEARPEHPAAYPGSQEKEPPGPVRPGLSPHAVQAFGGQTGMEETISRITRTAQTDAREIFSLLNDYAWYADDKLSKPEKRRFIARWKSRLARALTQRAKDISVGLAKDGIHISLPRRPTVEAFDKFAQQVWAQLPDEGANNPWGELSHAIFDEDSAMMDVYYRFTEVPPNEWEEGEESDLLMVLDQFISEHIHGTESRGRLKGMRLRGLGELSTVPFSETLEDYGVDAAANNVRQMYGNGVDDLNDKIGNLLNRLGEDGSL